MRVNTSQWDAAAAEFERAVAGAHRDVTGIVRDEGRDIMEDWRENASRTSGRAAKWYVPSIKARSRSLAGLRAEAEVGPDGPGGGVGFEFGSRNQPPHLDGQKAAQVSEDRFPKRVDEWIGAMFR